MEKHIAHLLLLTNIYRRNKYILVILCCKSGYYMLKSVYTTK